MLSDAKALWASASSMLGSARERVTKTLESFDLDLAQQNELNAELRAELETYKRLLEDSQMQHFELSKHTRSVMAEKEAEITVLRATNASSESGSGGTIDPLSFSTMLEVEKLKADTEALQKSLDQAENKLRDSLRERNDAVVDAGRYRDLKVRLEQLGKEHEQLRTENELQIKMKTETVENLVSEYSQLANEFELTSARDATRIAELQRSNDRLSTRQRALEHSVSELADRAVVSGNNSNRGNSSSSSSSSSSSGGGEGSDSQSTAQAAQAALALESELRSLRTQLASLELDLKEKAETCDALRAQQATLQRAATQAPAPAPAPAPAQQTPNLDLEAAVAALKEQLGAAKEHTAEQTQLVAELTAKLLTAEQEGKSLSARLGELEAEAKSQSRQLEDQAAANSSALLQQQAQRDAHSAVSSSLETSVTSAAELRAQLEQRDLEAQRAAQDKEQLTAALAKASAELQAAREEQGRLEEQHKKAQRETAAAAASAQDKAISEAVTEAVTEAISTTTTRLVAEASAALDAALGRCRADAARELASELDKLRAEHTAAMAAAAQEHSTAITSLKEEHTAAMAAAAQEHSTAITSLNEKHTAAMAAAAQVHSTAITSLKEEHTAAMAAAAQEHSTAITSLKEEHTAALAALAQEHSTAITSLDEKHTAAMAAAAQVHSAAITGLKEEHSTAITNLTSEHAAALAALAQEHSTAITSLKAIHAAATATAEQQHADATALLRQQLTAEADERVAQCQQAADLLLAAAEAARDQALWDQKHVEERYELKMKTALDDAERRFKAELQQYVEMYSAERQRRRAIHNKLLELQGNIRVVCRVRPVLEVERRHGSGEEVDVTEIPAGAEGELIVTRDPATKTKFEYDRVFAPGIAQQIVFDYVQPLATSVLDGYNVCIFAYGQTGSGKTFTMEGSRDDPGVSPRAVTELFRLISSAPAEWSYTVKFSMLEVYNESILDLLGDCKDKEAREKLDVRQTPDGKGVVVAGLIDVVVGSAERVMELMAQGQANRAVGAHDMNEHSSRSHSILTLTIQGRNSLDNTVSSGKLNLIDLAGSERISKTDATGDRLKEAQAINKSLSALGDVIAALGNKKNTHVPYRNSKLTYLLQDSLGGNSKVFMFCNVSPAVFNLGETVCSLNFASRCRAVELGAAKKNTAAAGAGGTAGAAGAGVKSGGAGR